MSISEPQALPEEQTEALDPERRLQLTPERLPSLSIVLPCFNEAENVVAMVADAQRAGRAYADQHEVILVDDGSRDGTGEIAAALAAETPELRVVTHGDNRGYGAAVRSGLAAGALDWLLLTDGDRQFDLMQLEAFVPRTATSDLVAGRRSDRADPLGRRLSAHAWNGLVRGMFRLPLRDVDCAFKLIRRSLLDQVELSADGAMISTELVTKCVRAGARVVELDVAHRPRSAGEQSGNNPRVVARAFRELARMRRTLAE